MSVIISERVEQTQQADLDRPHLFLTAAPAATDGPDGPPTLLLTVLDPGGALAASVFCLSGNSVVMLSPDLSNAQVRQIMAEKRMQCPQLADLLTEVNALTVLVEAAAGPRQQAFGGAA